MVGSDGTYPAGTIIDGRYKIERRLGRGGFATVYQAEHLQLGRKAALKILEPVAPHISERFQARFNTEARIAANLDHPNVVRIFDFGFIEGDERPYMAMELLDGCDLEEYLKTAGPMDPERAKRLFTPVLDALRVGHERGIVHKDLKPSNLYFVREGTPDEKLIVLDYGIARLEGDDNPRHTEEGTYTGTPAYMPPEYIHRKEVTPAYDVYQMGLIFIETMTGQPVVVAGSQIAYMVAHVEGQRNLPPGFGDTPLGAALLGALTVEPTQRYPDAGAMLRAIESAGIATGTDFTLHGTPIEFKAPVPAETAPGHPPVPPKKSSAPWIIIGLVVLALGGVGCTAAALLGWVVYTADEAMTDLEDSMFDEPAMFDTPAVPSMPMIGMPSDEGTEMNSWLMAQYMIMTTLNQITLYETTLKNAGGWTAEGAPFVPSGVDDLLGLAYQQLAIGVGQDPVRKSLESKTPAMQEQLQTLHDLLSDLYDYHSVRRGWESDGGAHGKELTRQIAASYKRFKPVFADWSKHVDRELMLTLARFEDKYVSDPFLQLSTRAMTAQARLIHAMVDKPNSPASNAALSAFDESLSVLEKHMRANRAVLTSRYQITMGIHDRYLSALKDTRKQAGELRADAAKGDTNDKIFLAMQLHQTFGVYQQLERF